MRESEIIVDNFAGGGVSKAINENDPAESLGLEDMFRELRVHASGCCPSGC